MVGLVEDVEEDGTMPVEGTQEEVNLQDRLEQQQEVDGTHTLDRVLVVCMDGEDGVEVIDHELLSLHRVEEGEHSSAVYRKIRRHPCCGYCNC